ncbi:uroporphyrinogen decarboxylase family protein [Natranaerofaba carboxydovora]|uniref:uroporphyrinogen decarboxylase family protein n=1 Tax=Natranaerofaba carboxydovora TaxID=2742683 RepID=UPI001F12C0EA|nr:uroporphyrinogen decarboxylase family protein [Natranaerofaba carboxydovora]UMZ72784.1 Uroporphyrinogen decarboxylase (URO-D) [Natranaerofaba carboxydovora]
MSKDRVINRIDGNGSDKIPTGELLIDEEVIKSYLKYDKVTFDEKKEFVNELDLDIITINPDIKEDSIDWKDLEKWAGNDIFKFVLLDGLFGWGVDEMGFEAFMIALMKQSKEFEDLKGKVRESFGKVAENIEGRGADGIIIADDIAYNKGVIVRPSLLREYYFPWLAEIVEIFKELGFYVFFHSDGYLKDVIDDLIGTGIDGMQCIERAAGMDVDSLIENYGEKLCFWGNVDISELMKPLNEEKLTDLIRSYVPQKANARYIFGTSSGLVMGVDSDNLKIYKKIKE